MSENTAKGGVPGPRAPLGLPPERVAAGPADGDDITDGMETAYWAVHDGASAKASVREILAQLPRIVRRVGALAWQADRRGTVAVAVLQLASAAMNAFGLVASVAVLRELFGTGPTPDKVRAALPGLMLVVALLSLRAALEAAVSTAEARLTPKIRTALEVEFYRLAAHVRLEAVDDAHWHDDIHRASDRGLYYARQIVGQIVALAAALLDLVATAAVLTVLHPLLILMLPLSVLPVGAAAVRAARERFHSYMRWNALQRRVRTFSWLLLDQDSAAEIRSNTTQGALLAEHRRLTEKIAAEDTRLGVRAARIHLAGRAAGGIGTGITYAALCAMLIGGWIPLAVGAGAVLAIQSSHRSLTSFVNMAHMVYEHALWVGDLLTVQARCRSLLPRTGGDPAPDRVDEIRLDGVSFTYPDKDTPALDGISLTLRAGETIAFVGVNGSGKSTCSKLIAGLYDPSAGTVTWNGTDAHDLDPVSLQQRVAMVLQDPVHYPFTALANITVSRGSLTDSVPEDVHAAATASGADTVIGHLPDTWETVLSKRFAGGQELSAGQWAKIAVARGLYKNAPVLLLDEPTASMDPRAEHAVYQAVLQEPRHPGQITVLISHRLASVADCDRIHVFDNGKIIESGTHRELMDKQGEYCQMFTLQAAGYHGAPTGADES
ncbi:ABC transporter ATP-binding protein [Streptomyces yaizuensis]|uniref:ABC transporter ATP-binding protein/permease n=1 Tax=Streptomyces yaizuensis TaxID=2989713 RepID=A0ABQ5NXG8_9ACTN|nr:ABC transporter ATP-binding protein [Streptomyces sp. YSPA8]GLF95052.1 ABC transporter ATP-binding protein/permease [Streptomyces sp. YSPA8]